MGAAEGGEMSKLLDCMREDLQALERILEERHAAAVELRSRLKDSADALQEHANAIATQNTIIAAKDAEIARLKQRDKLMRCGWCMNEFGPRPALDAHVTSCIKNPAVQEQVRLRSELSTVKARLAEATDILRIVHVDGRLYPLRHRMNDFLNAPEKSHPIQGTSKECRHSRWADACEKCDGVTFTVFDGKYICPNCIQRDLGRGER